MDRRAGRGRGYSKSDRRVVGHGRGRGHRQRRLSAWKTDAGGSAFRRPTGLQLFDQEPGRPPVLGHHRERSRTEPLAGAISLDGKTAYGADTDGSFHFTIRSADEIELCYTQAANGPTAQIVATCFLIKRK
jgi:hypothetical protein